MSNGIHPETSTADDRTPAERDRDAAILGWKMQRKLTARDRAESAQRAEAVATGRRIRGGTYRVTLPADLSTNPASPMAADLEYVEAPGTGALCEVVEVTLPRNVSTDPRNVWEPTRMLAAVNYAATTVARRSRGISADDSAEIAARVVADIMARTHGGYPMRTDLTDDGIMGACHHKAADIIREREAETPDALIGTGEAETVADAAAIADGDGQRAQRDADAMLDPIPDAYGRPIPGTGRDADPFPATCEALLADLTVGEREALRVALGERAADIARATGRTPGAVRVSVHKGRARIADNAILADGIRRAAGDETDAERAARIAASALRFMGNGDHGHARPILPLPDRYPARDADGDDGTTDPFTVPHAPIRISDVSTRGDLLPAAPVTD